MSQPTGKRAIEGWIRRLNDDRLEIFLKTEGLQSQPDRKIRASGSEAEMMELVEWFESKSGLRVQSSVLPRRAPKPYEGQLDLLDETGNLELESEEEGEV